MGRCAVAVTGVDVGPERIARAGTLTAAGSITADRDCEYIGTDR